MQFCIIWTSYNYFSKDLIIIAINADYKVDNFNWLVQNRIY